MMNHETELRLQAYLDGELSSKEFKHFTEWLATDRDAQALYTELKNTKASLAANELDLRITESREFYWSGIAREIQREDERQNRGTKPTVVSGWLRWLAPLAGLAALVVLLATWEKLRLFSQPDTGRLSLGHEIETPSEENSASITFHSEKAAMTVVWVQNRENN